ncbi:hypothetical protein RND71_018771 [Anisodus tanguticus]|uniref:C2 domain-containing protein n=1 Tax=Anisodus tanguticus TaxID=243964 RepID=A0AAE1S579_9SOLA|nr:hypothetical protein RND71_018771 [Anisodus tanguticus]
MGKIWIEVCLISARGLRRTSALWKLQWYAVGWIDPNNKYCSKIDSSGNANPVWKTKFSMLVDTSELDLQDLALHVEVYSREPIFLREKLMGTATVVLKEFLDKYNNNSEVSKPIEEVGAFNCGKRTRINLRDLLMSLPGFQRKGKNPVHNQVQTCFVGDKEGFKLADNSSGFNLANAYKPASAYPQPQTLTPSNQPQPNRQYAHPPSRAPPPPPANVGYIPTFLPRTDNMPPSYFNMPQTGPSAARNARPGFGMRVGAGALAAGAMIFGDDFISDFDLPRGLQDPSLTISLDPPF